MTWPRSTATEENRRLMPKFKALSLAQCRVLLAVYDLGYPTWWRALEYAASHYGAGSRLSHRSVQPLHNFGLIEKCIIRNEAGAQIATVIVTTMDGNWVRPLALDRHRAALKASALELKG